MYLLLFYLDLCRYHNKLYQFFAACLNAQVITNKTVVIPKNGVFLLVLLLVKNNLISNKIILKMIPYFEVLETPHCFK